MKYTLDQIADEALLMMDSSQKDQLKALHKEELYLTHFGFGMYLRNQLDLWRRPVFDSQGNLIHPDSVSQIVIERIWKKLQGPL